MYRSTLALCALLFAGACSRNLPERLDAARPDVIAADISDSSDAIAPTDVTADASTTDASDAGDAGCFTGTPHTRLEFLNRCTDAETTDKVVTLPLGRPDGTLPPLP